jgi:hypothetical protein
VEDLESRFGHQQEELLRSLSDEIASTLLPYPPAELEDHVHNAKKLYDAKHGKPVVEAQPEALEDEEDMFNHGEEEDQYVHEADWGADKEVGVGEEADDPNGLGE